MYRFRNRRQKCVLPITKKPLKKKSRREMMCLSWSNLALGALIPLSIGIGTVILTVLQQKTDNRRQHQERELDDRRYDQERRIDDRHYLLDQLLANLTRHQDLDIDETRRHQDLKLDDRRYELEQEQADQLYYQSVYKTYIEDISNVQFKQQNFSVFVNNATRLSYIRSKTLTALRMLDSEWKTFLFLFLEENQLLPRIRSPVDLSLDLSGTNLFNITITSTSYKKFTFNELSLTSVDLSNASFIECDFRNGGNFSYSSMTDTNFTGSKVGCDTSVLWQEGPPIFDFHRTILKRANFNGVVFCKVDFIKADLSYANFRRVYFVSTTMKEVNLAFADFTGIEISYGSPLIIINSNMTEALWDEQSSFNNWYNVILPNRTWYISDGNLIQNGNAEEECSGSSEQSTIPSWNVFLHSYPTLSTNQNVTMYSLGRCYFNFTFTSKKIAMSQTIVLEDYSLFIDSTEAVYELSAYINCKSVDGLEMSIGFYGKPNTTPLRQTKYVFNETKPGEWHRWSSSGTDVIPASCRSLKIYIMQVKKGDYCYLDNIEFHVRKGK